MKAFILLTTFFATFFCFGQNYPGKDIIGKSYNVFGEFANNKSIQRYPIFDFSKAELKTDQFGYSLPSVVYIENISDHIITTVEGTSIKEYSNSLAEKAGLSGDAIFFKGSVDYSTKEVNSTNDEVFMYTYMDINTKWRISLDTRSIDKLITLLDEQFLIDIETLSPKELFDNYGTHFMSSAYLGGRIDYITSTNLSSNLTKNQVKFAVEASYKALSGDYFSNETSNIKSNEINTKTKLNVVGGNSEYTNNIQNAEQYKKWAEGIVKSPVLCGFDDKSLMPIWMLTKNEARKLELENYFNTQIIPKYPFPLFFKSDPVLDNDQFMAHYAVFIDGFEIVDDCDPSTMLYNDDTGEFEYAVTVYENGNKIERIAIQEGYYTSKRAGQNIEIKKLVLLKFPLQPQATISVKYYLQENNDLLSPDVLGNATNTHKFPFSNNQLYNSIASDGTKYYKQNLYFSSTCEANLNYIIAPYQDPTAIEFGNKGWKEFELGNYNECLNYSRKALEINNTLWFAQFNVSLVYLIQRNPTAFSKYQTICNFCVDTDTLKAALQDIFDYEKKHGVIEGSEPIKLLLKSKMY